MTGTAADLGPRPRIAYWHLSTDEAGISHQRLCHLSDYQPHQVGGAAPQWNLPLPPSEASVVFAAIGISMIRP